MKRLAIMVLALAMVFGLSSTALAGVIPVGGDGVIQGPAFSDIAGHEAEGDLTLLGAMGIFTGEDGLGGAVNPDDPITRAQFCKVVVTAFGRGSTAAGLAGLQPTFTDGASIPTWAWGYVNVATYMGIINGYPDGSFRPDNPVSYAEAVTMLVRAVPGHLAQVPAGVWPYNYLFYGVDAGFTGNVDVGFANLPCTRGDMAQMLVAAMMVNRLDADGEELADDLATPENEGTAVLAGRYYDGIFDSYDLSNGVISVFQFGYMPLADEVQIVGADGYEGLLLLHVRVVADELLTPGPDCGQVFFIEVTEDASTVSGVFDSLDDADGDGANDAFILADGTEVPYFEDQSAPFDDEQVDLIINGGEGFHEGDLVSPDMSGAECVFALNEDGLAVSGVVIFFDRHDWIVEDGVVPSDPESDIEYTEVTFEDWGPQDVNTEDDPCAVFIGDEGASPDDLADFDYVDIATWGANGTAAMTIRATRKVVEGEVASVTTSYPGEVHRVTITDASDTDATYALVHDGGIGTICPMPTTGATVRYGLDSEGRLYVPIGFQAMTPFVLVKAFVEYGDGTATALVDLRGTNVTYNVADTWVDLGGTPGDYDDGIDVRLYDLFAGYASHELGYPLWVQVDPATNTIIDVAEPKWQPGSGQVVLANSDGNITLGGSLADPTVMGFLPADSGVAIYKFNGLNKLETYTPQDEVTLTDADDDNYLLWPTLELTSYGFDGEQDTVPAGLLYDWAPPAS